MKKRNVRKTMKGGGFLETLSNLGNSISQGATTLWEKTKNYTSSITTRSSNYTGGRRTRRRRMRGGFEDNTPTTGLASNAAQFSGPTAQPHNLVGGKSKRRGIKSRKHRRY
jgi:hypothetical protein